jgi:hypothetical protein
VFKIWNEIENALLEIFSRGENIESANIIIETKLKYTGIPIEFHDEIRDALIGAREFQSSANVATGALIQCLKSFVDGDIDFYELKQKLNSHCHW